MATTQMPQNNDDDAADDCLFAAACMCYYVVSRRIGCTVHIIRLSRMEVFQCMTATDDSRAHKRTKNEDD